MYMYVYIYYISGMVGKFHTWDIPRPSIYCPHENQMYLPPILFVALPLRTHLSQHTGTMAMLTSHLFCQERYGFEFCNIFVDKHVHFWGNLVDLQEKIVYAKYYN